MAADDSGNVYLAVTRYGGPKACSECPDPAIVFEHSDDGGRTWGDPRPLCRCQGVEEQADPVLTTDGRGRVFATWMNDYDVHFALGRLRAQLDRPRLYRRTPQVVG